MKRRIFLGILLSSTIAMGVLGAGATVARAASKEIAYITPSLSVSFWRYVASGVEAGAKEGGYSTVTLDSNNDGQTQLKNAQDAIARGVAGIVISPTDSSTAPSVLDLAAKAGIPVVICDIGTESGDYASFVTSDNPGGARAIGDAAAAVLKEKGWTDGSFGIIAIPQARKNGQARTKGFREAMAAIGMTKEVPMQQMQTFTADESFRFAQDMLTANPDLRIIFVQSDQQAIGAYRAVVAARKADSVLVAAFDGTPELLQSIRDGKIVGSGMQQPYLMGKTSAEALSKTLSGGAPEKDVLVPIMAVTSSNADENLDTIKLNVFANDL
ncbi:substrate-binding domain-containing protein [Sinorhizobium sp. BG8]|uniref:substrate-binding domain-containing protein n=1 Tax=Sinorhizobium sp. BG8 TaxID=2613773 RepID=UPI00193D0CF2|nr:substrate-binding domain-containing protein [Sinorhizobium sp. BG8]QRM57769.1 substrate-binding domain-containing protein [Sinorhizobium sp. BG8]